VRRALFVYGESWSGFVCRQNKQNTLTLSTGRHTANYSATRHGKDRLQHTCLVLTADIFPEKHVEQTEKAGAMTLYIKSN
jgi:hypothetical protein